jgi:hypothetical protein
VGLVATAWWAGVSLLDLTRITSQQYKSPLPDPTNEEPPFGLPWLTRSFRLDAPAWPLYLFWLNYWSDEAARLVGFDERLAQTVFSEVRRVDSGWLLRLTNEPFDSSRKDHVARLIAGYQHFKGVGRVAQSDRLQSGE